MAVQTSWSGRPPQRRPQSWRRIVPHAACRPVPAVERRRRQSCTPLRPRSRPRGRIRRCLRSLWRPVYDRPSNLLLLVIIQLVPMHHHWSDRRARMPRLALTPRLCNRSPSQLCRTWRARHHHVECRLASSTLRTSRPLRVHGHARLWCHPPTWPPLLMLAARTGTHEPPAPRPAPQPRRTPTLPPASPRPNCRTMTHPRAAYAAALRMRMLAGRRCNTVRAASWRRRRASRRDVGGQIAAPGTSTAAWASRRRTARSPWELWAPGSADPS